MLLRIGSCNLNLSKYSLFCFSIERKKDLLKKIGFFNESNSFKVI